MSFASKLTANLDHAAQVTYASGSEKLHELVVEKNGKLDPEGVSEALKIVEGMLPSNETGYDFGNGKYDWSDERLLEWIKQEVGGEGFHDFHGVLGKPKLFYGRSLYLNGAQALNVTELPPGLIVSGDLNLNDCINLKVIRSGLSVSGNLDLVGTRLNPTDISPDIKVTERVMISANRQDLGAFFTALGIKIGYRL